MKKIEFVEKGVKINTKKGTVSVDLNSRALPVIMCGAAVSFQTLGRAFANQNPNYIISCLSSNLLMWTIFITSGYNLVKVGYKQHDSLMGPDALANQSFNRCVTEPVKRK